MNDVVYRNMKKHFWGKCSPAPSFNTSCNQTSCCSSLHGQVSWSWHQAHTGLIHGKSRNSLELDGHNNGKLIFKFSIHIDLYLVFSLIIKKNKSFQHMYLKHILFVCISWWSSILFLITFKCIYHFSEGQHQQCGQFLGSQLQFFLDIPFPLTEYFHQNWIKKLMKTRNKHVMSILKPGGNFTK